MANRIDKKCPICGKKAKGSKKVRELFGFRFRPNGIKQPQSYCVKCRGIHN